ncbi:MAG TPA: hypothetical protein VGN88_04770, partial [Phycisphaerae bacterium]
MTFANIRSRVSQLGSSTGRPERTRAARHRKAKNASRMNCAVIDALEPRTLLSATHLAFAIQPTDTVAGASISSITVNVEDSGNSIVANDQSLVVFSIATGPDGTEGTLFFAVPAVNGVATLSNLGFTVAGDYTLQADDGSLTS